MTLCPLPLDDRTLPTAMTWYGGSLWLAGHSVTPFEGWDGSLVSVAVDGLVYVGAGSGGGPRVAVFDGHGGRTQPDHWAGDPASRAGVVFVVPQQPVSPPDRPLDAGPADGFPVYVDFETARPTDWHRRVFDGIAGQLVPLGVRLTTTRPDALPNTYGQILVGPWTFTGAGGAFPGPTWDTPISDYTPRTVWVGDYPEPEVTVTVGVHEFGHALDLPHVDDPTDVMDATAHPGAKLSATEVATLTDRITHLRGR